MSLTLAERLGFHHTKCIRLGVCMPEAGDRHEQIQYSAH